MQVFDGTLRVMTGKERIEEQGLADTYPEDSPINDYQLIYLQLDDEVDITGYDGPTMPLQHGSYDSLLLANNYGQESGEGLNDLDRYNTLAEMDGQRATIAAYAIEIYLPYYADGLVYGCCVWSYDMISPLQDAGEFQFAAASGEIEVSNLVKMGGERASTVLAGLSQAQTEHTLFYTTSDSLAEAVEEGGDSSSDEAVEALQMEGGSIIAARDDSLRSLDVDEVSDGEAALYMQWRLVDETLDMDSLKEIARELGARHMLVMDGSTFYQIGGRFKPEGAIVYYTMGADSAGMIWFWDDGSGPVTRVDYAGQDENVERGIGMFNPLPAALEKIENKGLDAFLEDSDLDADDVYYE